MRFFDNNATNPDAYYEPNSFNGPKEDKRCAGLPQPLNGDADRYNHRGGNDDYTQVETRRHYMAAAGFVELTHYYRPPGPSARAAALAGECLAQVGILNGPFRSQTFYTG